MSRVGAASEDTERGGRGSPAQWLRRQWTRDWVRGPLLLVYYLGLIYVLVQLYGSGVQQAPPPFIYQGF